MRAREFLLEYRRDETAKRLGSRLVAVEPGHTDVDEILARLEAMDPTPNKKYVQWIATQYINKVDGHLQFRLEDAPRIKQTLERFEQIKRNLPQKDINKYTYYSLEDTVDSAFDVELQQPDQKAQTQQQTYKVPKNADVLYNGPLGLLAIPRTEKASCKLGKGTSWCTARNDEENMFREYNDESELYIWHDKSGKKYQFYFGSDMQFMDQKDRDIDGQTLQYFAKKHPVLKKLFAQKEPEIAQNPKMAYQYARDAIGGRWPEAEEVISQSYYSVDYAKDVIKGRWPKAEPVIAKKYERQAYNYARDVIRGRFPEAEPVIAKDTHVAIDYARDVIKGRWPEAEPKMAQNPYIAFRYAKDVIKGRWPAAEPVIARDPDEAVPYAKYVLKRRWPEAEPAIMKDPFRAHQYANDVIGGRWLEAEPVFAQDAASAFYYAKYVLKRRWPEGEPAILRHAGWTDSYAKDVIKKGPWPEAGIKNIIS